MSLSEGWISQFSPVNQLCLTLQPHGLESHQVSLSITNSRNLLILMLHQVSDAIQPSLPPLSPSPPAFYLSQHQGLFQ